MKLLSFALRSCIAFILMLGIFIGLKYLSASIDRDSIRTNAIRSFALIEEEGEYPRIIPGLTFYQLDNYTDVIMLDIALTYDPRRSVMQNAMSGLQTGIYGEYASPEEYYEYSRYWQGYDTTLRPMLKILDLNGIRILNCIALFLLGATAAWLIWRKVSSSIAVLFIGILMVLGLPVVALSLQYASCFYIFLSSCIALLALPRRFLTIQNAGIFFMVIGGLTSFLDFLTAPLLTFGFPAVVLLLRRRLLPDWKCLIVVSAMWLTGYAGIWVSKWILTSCLTDIDVWSSAISSIKCRMSTASSVETMAEGFHPYKNILLAVGLTFLAIAAFIWILVEMRGAKGIKAREYLSLAIVGVIPFFWILLLQNHSFTHYWFVWRILGVSMWGLGCWAILIHKYTGIHFKLYKDSQSEKTIQEASISLEESRNVGESKE